MSFAEKIKNEASVRAKALAEKSQNLVVDNKDKIIGGLDRTQSAVDAKTQGKYHDTLGKSATKLRRPSGNSKREEKVTRHRHLGSNAGRNTDLDREGVVDGVVEARSVSWRSRRGTGSCCRAGVGTVEACRRVGITRKTGYRWRAEAGGVTPLRLADAVRSNRYLSMVERQRIAGLQRQGLRHPRDRAPVGSQPVHGEPGASP